MTRSLFFSFFIRITIALALVALLRMWLTPRGWILGAVLVVAWAALNAFLLMHAVRRNIEQLQDSTDAMPQRHVGVIETTYSDFNGLARSISLASDHVEHALNAAAESRRELEAMIDSMQNAVVAVDSAGRIQWSNQRMQRLVPDASSGSAVRTGHALVQTIRDPSVLDCVRSTLEQRTISEGRSTSLVPGRIYEISRLAYARWRRGRRAARHYPHRTGGTHTTRLRCQRLARVAYATDLDQWLRRDAARP